jgi:F-type H+-transporting ATPase subunit beta
LLVGRNKNYFNKKKKFMSGFVTQIIGPVIDVEFPEGELPAIYNALKVTKETSKEIIVEVQYLIGENKALISVTTDGLKRGDVAVDTGTSIKVPVENQL